MHFTNIGFTNQAVKEHWVPAHGTAGRVSVQMMDWTGKQTCYAKGIFLRFLSTKSAALGLQLRLLTSTLHG
jgi:hypothetical protein